MQQHKNGDAPHQDAATAVSHFHTHSVPLDMEDIRRDWDKPISEAGLAAKTSVVVRVGALDLGAGTGSFRVREMMHRIAYPLGVHVRADVNLTDIEATCTDDANRITEVIDLPTTGVNTERIWLLEHYTDWFSVNLGLDSMYHRAGDVSEGVVQNLEQSDMSEVSAQLAKKLRAEKKAQKELSGEASDDPVLDALEAAEVTVPVSMVRAAAADITAEGSTDDELRSESEAALKEDREAKLLHDRLMQQRSGKHDFVETPDLDAAAAAAGGAGAGAGAGIAFLCGADYATVAHTVINAVAVTSGIVCDGAKASCAGKISVAVDAGIMGYEMCLTGNNFHAGDGILADGVENTIKNVGRLGRVGMRDTDREIMKIMTGN